MTIARPARERPILFSAPMVRALLADTKTQTRRIVKPQPQMVQDKRIAPWEGDAATLMRLLEQSGKRCPHGKRGDRLWVHETWAQPTNLDPGPTFYRADYPACVPAGFENVPPASAITWKPSIHMFRKDSRITLEVVSVRVERLQDISVADSIAEGIPRGGPENPDGIELGEYRSLWESINGQGSWALNPWVWVVEFRRLRNG